MAKPNQQVKGKIPTTLKKGSGVKGANVTRTTAWCWLHTKAKRHLVLLSHWTFWDDNVLPPV